MGKRTRERKVAKLTQLQQEKMLIESRRASQLKPVYRTVRKITLAVMATVLLLYLGIFINQHLGGVINRLSGNG